MECKVRVRLGVLEMEFEGSEDYLRNHLPGFLDKMVTLVAERKIDVRPEPGPGAVVKTGDLSVSQYVTKLGSKGGSGLVMAAANYLTHTKGQAEFTRDELTAAMRTATSFFKKTYVGNLSGYLKRLSRDGRIHERGDNRFSLAAAD